MRGRAEPGLCSCAFLPFIFPHSSPWQDTSHVVSLVICVTVTPIYLQDCIPQLKPSSQIIKQNIYVSTYAFGHINKNNSFLSLYHSKIACLTGSQSTNCFSQIKIIELNRATE